MVSVDGLAPLAGRFELAIQAIRNAMTMREAAREFQVPKTSLHRRVHTPHLQRNGRPTILSEKDEQGLLEVLQERFRTGTRVTTVELKQWVPDLATRRGHRVSEAFPDHKWIRRFSQRYRITVTKDRFLVEKAVHVKAAVNSACFVSCVAAARARQHLTTSHLMQLCRALPSESSTSTTARADVASSRQHQFQHDCTNIGCHSPRSPSYASTDREHTLSPIITQRSEMSWPQLNLNDSESAVWKAQQLVGLDLSQTAALMDILSTANEDPVVLLIQPNQQWLRYHDAATVKHVLDAIATFDMPCQQRRDAEANCFRWCFRFSSIDDAQRCQDEVFARFPETLALAPRAIARGIKDAPTIPMALATLLTRIGAGHVDVSLFGFFQL